MKIELRLSISRPSSGGINIRIEDPLSHIEFIDATISCEEFAEAITGLQSRPMSAEIRGIENIGKKKIREERRIVCPLDSYDRKILESWLRNNAHEDGWIVDSYLGSQQSASYIDNKRVLDYAVYKFINQDSGELFEFSKT